MTSFSKSPPTAFLLWIWVIFTIKFLLVSKILILFRYKNSLYTPTKSLYVIFALRVKIVTYLIFTYITDYQQRLSFWLFHYVHQYRAHDVNYSPGLKLKVGNNMKGTNDINTHPCSTGICSYTSCIVVNRSTWQSSTFMYTPLFFVSFFVIVFFKSNPIMEFFYLKVHIITGL